jgi:hypothetical protein
MKSFWSRLPTLLGFVSIFILLWLLVSHGVGDNLLLS